MTDISGWLGELPPFELLPLKTQMEVVRIIEHILKNPASTLPYFKKVLGMHSKNKYIKTPELWPDKNMIVANVREYKPSKYEVVEGGFRGINTNKLAIYLATRTRFKPITEK